MKVRCGTALRLRRAHETKPHLWIVITGPCENPPRVAIVAVTTLRGHSDATTVLQVGDHPFIRWESCIDYGDTLIVDIADLEKAVSNGQATIEPDCSEELLYRVQEGIGISRRVTPRVLKFCQPHL